jgi:hypothetical protein
MLDEGEEHGVERIGADLAEKKSRAEVMTSGSKSSR